MSVIPCPNPPPPCPPGDNPLQGFGSEGPDSTTFVSDQWGNDMPPLGSDWKTWPCFAMSQSQVSQDDSDAIGLAEIAACEANGRLVFGNRNQSCQSLCDDGLPFTFTVAENRFFSFSQLMADRMAFTFACKQVTARRVCMSPLSDNEVCATAAFTGSITATGRFQPFIFSVSAGSLPPGMTLTQVTATRCEITGTCTVPGLYSFMIQAVDRTGSFMQKPFVITVQDCSNDEVYFVHDCGADTLTLSVTPPSWITVDTLNSRLVGAAGTYTADSKADANVLAQSALDAYATTQLALGNLSCSTCVAPPFPPQLINGNIDGTVPSPDIPGNFAVLIPFNGVAGQVLNLFMFNMPVIFGNVRVRNPDTTLAGASIVSPYQPDTAGDVWLQIVLTQTGLYEIECTTDPGVDPGGTGVFSLAIASGPTANLALAGFFNYKLAYAPTSQLLFVCDQNSDQVLVINPVTNAIIATLHIAGSGGVTDLVYGSGQDIVYAMSIAAGNYAIQEISSAGVLGLNYATALSSVGSAVAFIDYDAVRDRIVFVTDRNAVNYQIIDCVTRASVTSAALGATGAGVAFSAANNQYYFSTSSPGGTIYKVDAVTLANVASVLTGPPNVGFSIDYIAEVGRLIITMAGPIVNVVNPATDTVVQTINGMLGFEYATYDPCNHQIRLDQFNMGMVCISDTTFLPVNFFSIGTSGISEGATVASVNSRTYALDRNNNVLYAIP